MVRYLLRYPLLRPLPNSKEQLESTPTPKKKQRKEQKKNSTGMGTDHMGAWGTLLIAHLYSVSWEEIYLEKQFFASTRSCYSVKNL